MKSVWSDHSNIPQFPQLRKDIKTEVLIIGGGMCGVLCAYFLEQKGIDYVLVEGERIGQGITKNTTAKVTSQHGLIYDKLIKNAGIEKAKMYLRSNEDAVTKYRELCQNIKCDFEQKDAYTYSLSDRKQLEDEVKAVNVLGLKAELVDKLPLPFETKGAIKVGNQAQFNPLLFLSEIAKGLKIYENTFIRDIKDHTAIADDVKITANKIIVATHFPLINKHGSYFLKMYQHRSYVIALENAPKVNGMYVDEAQKGMSFRNYEDLLLIGGGDHRTGKSGGNWQELRDFAKKNYPKAIEKYAWATQDCMSLDGIPYIGHYSKQTPHMYVATGFNKWGMTSSMVAAMILSDMVMGKDNEWRQVYTPHRSMIKPQLFMNGVEAVSNLLTPTMKRCPHMGCALKWNKIERTWDCPCHGSRFDNKGQLIDNPAKHNAKV
ncbi:Glycine/D-amino acid oxidase [Anaerosporobacter mobilis DSM 15930]|jgi:glycine/D-amino acid oxidase-like deaminating enzyme|uniref:Glycine/D-amino acid oxidase n=1 Tax=Anaerosporobacter mobilis DSM 15930 TaxID=1120996 RepID=A0A1M7KD28_9FIRM|nr:FAD-dependent oxidoreductase [Anaerosporobacter mobilis]SHM63169.1 Glycine/D-amino acid oxidase [Anaerosporobacter mobilis DSM 15930]